MPQSIADDHPPPVLGKHGFNLGERRPVARRRRVGKDEVDADDNKEARRTTDTDEVARFLPIDVADPSRVALSSLCSSRCELTESAEQRFEPELELHIEIRRPLGEELYDVGELL